MKHKIEIFSAGCKTCKDVNEAVRKQAGSEHEVVVHDMHQQAAIASTLATRPLARRAAKRKTTLPIPSCGSSG